MNSPEAEKAIEKEIEEILNMPPEQLLAEVEKLPGGVKWHVARMKKLIRQAVKKANNENKN